MEPNKYLLYHLQEAGATPEQELSFALATAVGIIENLNPISKKIRNYLKKLSEE